MNIAELMLIAIVALIVIGPKKLPEVASVLGKAIKACRNLSATLKSEFEKQINHHNLQQNEERAAAADKEYREGE